jgi:hypothetical protein
VQFTERCAFGIAVEATSSRPGRLAEATAGRRQPCSYGLGTCRMGPSQERLCSSSEPAVRLHHPRGCSHLASRSSLRLLG